MKGGLYLPMWTTCERCQGQGRYTTSFAPQPLDCRACGGHGIVPATGTPGLPVDALLGPLAARIEALEARLEWLQEGSAKVHIATAGLLADMARAHRRIEALEAAVAAHVTAQEGDQ